VLTLLRSYGFERFKVNSYEQFCINYANERLQHEFNRHVFKLEQDEYLQEQIEWTFIDFADNQPTIDMIEGKLGILSLLDEESRLPSGSDASFLQKLFTQLERRPELKDSFKRPRFGQTSFTVCHYALDVTYESEGFLEKNRDTVPDEHLALLSNTTNNFLKDVLETATAIAQASKDAPAPAAGKPGEAPAADAKPAPRRAGAGGMVKKPTLGSQFKASLVSLMTTMEATNVHYIRCIKPNEAKKAWGVEPQNVLGQLRACGVLETIRISCAGYPSRWTFADFADRYYMLVPSKHWDMSTMDKVKDLATFILRTTITDEDKYQIGLSKIFFRAGMLAHFEQRRGDRLNALVTLIQKNLRRNHEQKRYQKLRVDTVRVQTWWRMVSAQHLVHRLRQDSAAVRIQSATRAFLARQSFLRARRAVVAVQSMARGMRIRSTFMADKREFAITQLQSLLRGALARRQFAHERKGIIHLQSCYRRRLAKKELIGLRNEAKSANHFKMVSGRLENKVVELTQNLQARTKANKELSTKIRALEAQVKAWQGKHEEIDGRARGLEEQLALPTVPLAEFEQLMAEKRDIEAQHQASMKRVAEHEARVSELEAQMKAQAQDIEAKELALKGIGKTSDEDTATITTLRTEVATLRAEVNRANALATLSKNSQRIENAAPPVFQMSTGKDGFTSQGKRRPRRHSEVGPWSESVGNGVEADLDMTEAKRSVAHANRHVSMAFQPGQGPRPEDYDEESAAQDQIVSILEDEEGLDRDVVSLVECGLCRTAAHPLLLARHDDPQPAAAGAEPAEPAVAQGGLLPGARGHQPAGQRAVEVRHDPRVGALPGQRDAAGAAARHDVPGRGRHRAGHLLALQHPRGALLRVHRRVRHAAGHRPGHGRCRAAL
jgi:myosin-5